MSPSSQTDWTTFAKKKIAERRWEDVKRDWASYVAPTRIAGGRPTDELSELLTEVAQQVERGTDQRFDAVPGLSESILAEGLFLIHTAVRVIGAAQVHVDSGARTWSIVSAYQGAFFAAKGILRLCGIAHAEVNNKTLFIDVFSPRPNWKAKSGLTPHQTLVAQTSRMEHRQYWIFFTRMLRAMKGLGDLPREIIGALATLDESDFARQRNSLSYRCSEWPTESIYAESHEGYSSLDALERIDDPSCNEFTIAVALALLELSIAFVDDLAADLPVLLDDQAIIKSYVGLDEHRLFHQALGR